MRTITTDELDLLRLGIDELIQNAKIVNNGGNTEKAHDSLLMAKAKLGKAKGELGVRTPYTVANEVANIPKTDAVAAAEIFISIRNENENVILSNINIMRDKIKNIQNIMEWGKFGNGYYSQSFQHLDEASIWYGFELQKLREG